MNVICGIVTYNPEIDKLKSDINSIINQVKEIIIVDNGSNNLKEIKKIFNGKIIENKKNMGIACALNQIMQYAFLQEYEWVLTLDQDSICPDNLMVEYSKYWNDNTIGIICPKIMYKGNEKLTINDKNTKEIEWCITSACMMRVSAWEKAGKYDENLFIDYVDKDMCIRVKNIGYRIIQLNQIKLLHELGNLKSISIGKFHLWIENHNSFRKYYRIRNSIIVTKKLSLSKKELFLDIIVDYLKVIFFEKNKIEKLNKMNKGLIEGLHYH